jgi:hypothetical protein
MLSRILRRTYPGIKRAIRSTSTDALEALICLPPLELIVLGEASSAAYLESGGLTFDIIEGTAAYRCGFRSLTSYLAWGSVL